MPKRKKRKRRRHRLGRGRIVLCTFECPAKGRVELRMNARKKETLQEACQRGLREKVRIDRPQIPLCKRTRMREID